MNKTTGFKIDGIIKLTSPLHVTSQQDYFMDKNGYFSFTKGEGATRVTRTISFSVINNEGELVRDIPMLPANGLRGRLRRHATKIVLNALRKNNQHVTIDAFHGMTSGAVTGVPDKSTTLISRLLSDRSHLFLGLFGGGPRISAGGYIVSDLIPATELTSAIGMVPDSVNFQPPYVELGKEMGQRWLNSLGKHGLGNISNFIRIDDIKKPLSIETMSGIADFEKTSQDWLKEIITADKVDANVEGADESKRNPKAISNMMTVEAVMPGTPMYFNLEGAGYLSPAQTGLMLLAVESMVAENAFGGWIRNGFGKYNASELTITTEDGQESLFIKDGGKLVLNQNSEFIESCLVAVNEAFDALTSEDINGVYLRSVEPSAAEKSAKEEKAAAKKAAKKLVETS